jgi:oxygen-independent coproporphyrinogen-3 oxidase
MSSSLINTVTPEMIKRYNRPGPRYTSYPTVPVWNHGQFSEKYADSLYQEGLKDRPVSLYVHIPFCRQLCTFCGCNKYITGNKQKAEEYLSALDNEIAGVAKFLRSRKKLAQVHFGGGTPTYLNTDQLERVVKMIVSRFDVIQDGEWAFEADPRVTTNNQLEALYKLGFRRVSFGVQDLNRDVQKAINRNQTVKQSWQTLTNARSLGYTSINLDLVYGLPLQTHQSFCKTLEEVDKMRPDRLAVYSFAFLPGMIGMDHYALPEDELALALKNRTLHRNFMGYTTLHNMAQIGVGVSAISDFGDSYWQNSKDLDQYLGESCNKKLNPRRGIQLDKEDLLRRELIETLMCHGEISIPDFETRYEINFSKHFEKAWTQLEKFDQEGLLKLNSRKIDLTPIGMLFTRNIAMPFDRYLTESSSMNFSKTV